MMPESFPQKTHELKRPANMAEDECGPLPVAMTTEGSLVSCWRMTWSERLSALAFGRVWVWVHTGTKTQPPVALTVARNVFR